MNIFTEDIHEVQKLLIVFDSYFIKGFLYQNGKRVHYKKLSIPQEFFNPLFKRAEYVSDFISSLSNDLYTYSNINENLDVEIYTSYEILKKDFLKVANKVYITDQEYFKNTAKDFAKKFNNATCYVVNVSRNGIFISSSGDQKLLNKDMEQSYDDIFRMKDISDFALIQNKLKKTSIFNAISKFPQTKKEYIALPIIAVLLKNFVKNISLEDNGTTPIIILTGDLYQFMAAPHQYQAILSLLYGVELYGAASLYVDDDNIFSLTSVEGTDDMLEHISHLVDIFTIGFDHGASLKATIPIKIVDDESIREVVVERENITNIPVFGRAHITIKLPKNTFIGTKRNEVELVSRNNIVIDTRGSEKIDIVNIKKWVENLEPFSF
ncbi:MAG: hypothetical protein ACYDAS_03730 [Patescibacteria group bacterium]